MKTSSIVLVLAGLALVPFPAGAGAAEGFSRSRESTLSAEKVARMDCHYFIELLGVASPSQLARQLDPVAGTEVDTVVCCPMGWRFYNFPSAVDLTWKEPDKFPRNTSLFPQWRKMVDNLQRGNDPLRDALAATRKLGKAFVVSFRMNDNHYVQTEDFPTHNNFWRAHPEYRLGEDTSPYSTSSSAKLLNYQRPEVRDFYFSVLEEICAKYDVDGVELDFQRAPRFFRDVEIAQGRQVMTDHVHRIRQMLDRIGATRGRHLRLGARVLHTVQANFDIGLDVVGWDGAGWLDEVIVSPSYIHTTEVGIEGFVARRHKAHVLGELNFVQLQLSGTGHDAQDRRYLTPENYRAATLEFLERGADGVSFFNTYCIPQPALGALTATLLTTFKDLSTLRQADKNYSCYASKATMFGAVFPAKNQKEFDLFVGDEIPDVFHRAALRFETKASCDGLRIEASINGVTLKEYASTKTELFAPLATNRASPKKENLRFFAVPLSALRFGVNRIAVRNADATHQECTFTSAELALYAKQPP